MELKAFVSAALQDIVGGVQDAQSKLPPGVIVPAGLDSDYRSIEAGISSLQFVAFEVTVSAEDRSGSEGKLNVVAAIVGGGIKAESTRNSGHAASLNFRIPIQLPASKPGNTGK